MRSIMRWIRQKWQALSGDKLYIVNSLSVPTSGLYITTAQLPYSTTLNTRAPSGAFTYEWRWITPPIRGVTLDFTTSAYTVLRIAADAEIGVLGRLECVARSWDAEYVSQPYAIQVLPTDNNV